MSLARLGQPRNTVPAAVGVEASWTGWPLVDHSMAVPPVGLAVLAGRRSSPEATATALPRNLLAAVRVLLASPWVRWADSLAEIPIRPHDHRGDQTNQRRIARRGPLLPPD